MEQLMHPVGQVKVRGTQDGIVFQLPDDLPSDEVVSQIRDAVERGGDFYRDARVVIDFDHRLVEEQEIERIERLLNQRGIVVGSVTASRPESRATLTSIGRRPLRIVARRDDPPTPRGQPEEERQALYVRRTLRSGASVVSDGDLIVMGDVNPGAEVVAAGDVVVWGSLRGLVHAGASGDREAIICALRLQPTQLRIGRLMARVADGEQHETREAQRAYVDRDTIVVEPWRGMERRGK
jgi:septum site-determining protein MinC